MDVQQLKSSVDLLALVMRDTAMRKVASTNGGEWAGPCPFCGGHDRFRVQPVKGLWWCRQCSGEHWSDAIAYVMKRDNCDFKEAAYRLIGNAISGEFKSAPIEPVETCVTAPNPMWQERATALVKWARANLWVKSGSRAFAWLLGRGLTAEALDEADLGFIPNYMYVASETWGLSKGDHRSLYLPRGILIPCWFSGMIWYLNVRRPVGEPKYMKVLGSVRAFYAPFARGEHDTLCLCEGEFDALLLRQECGDLVDVGTLGSASIKRVEDNWLPMLSQYKRILACHDDDHDGNICAQALEEFSPTVKRLRPIGGKDITDMYKAGGDLRAWVQSAVAELSHAEAAGSHT